LISDTGNISSGTSPPYLEECRETPENPVSIPCVSLPVRFEKPQIPDSERSVADISVDNLFIDQSIQVIDCNETVLQNVNQILIAVDRVQVDSNIDSSPSINPSAYSTKTRRS